MREPSGDQVGSASIATAAGDDRPSREPTVDGVSRASTGWTTGAGRAVFILGLLMSVTLRGAVGPVTLLVTVALFGIALLFGALSPPGEARARRSLRLSLALAAGLALYLMLQSWSLPGNPFASPLWGRVDHLLDTNLAAVSVAPAVTLGAIVPLIAPFLVYAAGLALFRHDEGGILLLRWVTVLGVGFALFGLLQLAVFPDRLLFVAKTNYLDSLTGFFVNRNTAGTFLGVASLAALTLLVCPEPNADDRSPPSRSSETGAHRAATSSKPLSSWSGCSPSSWLCS